MKVTQKKLDDGTIAVSAVASTAEVGKALQRAHVLFAQQMNLRPEPGKTVSQVAEERMGIRDLDAVVQTQAAESLLPYAIDKTGIIPAFLPKLDPKSNLKRGQTFQFELILTPRPEFELTSYDPVEITAPPMEAIDKDVKDQLKEIANTYAEYVADDPHPIAKGDACKIKMKAFREDGEEIKPLTTEGRTYVAGMGYMPEEFDSNIIGMNVGETKTFEFATPDIDKDGNEVTSKFTTTVTVLEAQKRVAPTLDDAWVKKNMPYHNDAAGLRKNIEESVMKQHQHEHDVAVRQNAAAEAAKRFEGSISDEVYQAMTQNFLGNIRQEVTKQGMSFDDFVEQQGGKQQFNIMLMMQVRTMLVQGYTLDAFFRHYGLVISDEDIEDACREMGDADPKAIRHQLEDSGRGFVLREAAERMCANKWLVKHAVIEEAAPAQAAPASDSKD